MLTLLHGEDRHSSFERLVTLVTDGERSNGGRGVEWFEGELLEPPFEALLKRRGLFGPRRVVIHDLTALKKPPSRAFIAALIASRDEFIVRERGALSPVALKGYGQATVEVFPLLTGERLQRRLKTLAEGFGRDLTSAELGKIAHDSKGDLFTAVSTLLSVAPDRASPDRLLIFRFLRALVNQEAASLEQLLRLRQSGVSDQYLLTMMAWQLKQLLLIVTGEESAVADWQRRALRPALKFWSEERLRAEYFRLVKADHDLKSGALPETLGLDYLVLCLLQPTATLA